MNSPGGKTVHKKEWVIMVENTQPSPEMAQAFALLAAARSQIESVVIGKSQAISLALVAYLSKGHVLLEDLPGTGKTTLAKTIARTLGLGFKRIQFTPDLMPSDITGMNYYNTQSGEFIFRPGPVFTNILLADEINRTTPRTQSALLEAMEEQQVTIEGVTKPLPQPFFVIATQNPIDSEGTFPLPSAQQDRFLLKIRLGYPSRADEVEIVRRHAFSSPLEALSPILTEAQALFLRETAVKVYLDDSLVDYILDIIEATRNRDEIGLALSSRSSLAMVRAAKALALIEGRAYVLPDDIKALAVPVFGHRLMLKKAETYKGKSAEDLLQQMMGQIPLAFKGDAG